MAGFGRTWVKYARPYRAQALLVFLTQTPSVAFVTVQPLLLSGPFSDLLRSAPQLRTVVERVADARQHELAALR